jgi:hypothetical protein
VGPGGSGDDVVVVCNFVDQPYANYQIGMPTPGLWRVRFNSDSGFYSFGNWPTYDTEVNGPAMNECRIAPMRVRRLYVPGAIAGWNGFRKSGRADLAGVEQRMIANWHDARCPHAVSTFDHNARWFCWLSDCHE